MIAKLPTEAAQAPSHNSSPLPAKGRSRCGHDVGTYIAGFCAICWMTLVWESEVPKKIHAYKVLADNGNPQVAPSFWSHLEASLGLVRPKQGENLKSFRASRGQLYRPPSKNQFPLLRALWNCMGYQPSLTTALIRSLQGRDLLEIAVELQMSPYGASQALSKGTRLILREIRSFDNGR